VRDLSIYFCLKFAFSSAWQNLANGLRLLAMPVLFASAVWAMAQFSAYLMLLMAGGYSLGEVFRRPFVPLVRLPGGADDADKAGPTVAISEQWLEAYPLVVLSVTLALCLFFGLSMTVRWVECLMEGRKLGFWSVFKVDHRFLRLLTFVLKYTLLVFIVILSINYLYEYFDFRIRYFNYIKYSSIFIVIIKLIPFIVVVPLAIIYNEGSWKNFFWKHADSWRLYFWQPRPGWFKTAFLITSVFLLTASVFGVFGGWIFSLPLSGLLSLLPTSSRGMALNSSMLLFFVSPLAYFMMFWASAAFFLFCYSIVLFLTVGVVTSIAKQLKIDETGNQTQEPTAP